MKKIKFCEYDPLLAPKSVFYTKTEFYEIGPNVCSRCQMWTAFYEWNLWDVYEA
jgi:hypothetical protein